MTRRINYEDDIFSVGLHVRTLQDTLGLAVDPDLFRERVLGDIAWIDAATARLTRSLRESPPFVRRREHLREVQKLSRAFADALDALLEGRAPLAPSLADRQADLRARRDAHLRSAEEIAVVLEGGDTADEAPIVSDEELRFLMTADEGEDGEE